MCVVHAAVLAPLIDHHPGGISSTRRFWRDSRTLLNGRPPYAYRNFEYPPLALPVIAAPATFTTDGRSYGRAFAAEMLLVDLAIVVMLAFGVGRPPEGANAGSDGEALRRTWAALGVYTGGVALLAATALKFGSSSRMATLPLNRFDLFPAACILAAVLARQAGRSASWSFLLSLGTAIKAFPAVLFPILLRGERRLIRVAVAAAVPIAAAAALVLGLDDQFGSAIAYHSHRELQVESVAATPLLIGRLLDLGVHIHRATGSFNLIGDGAALARAITIGLLIGGYALVVFRCWRDRIPVLQAATTAVAVGIVFSPVFSPQFLLWLLPLSAAAYGFRAPNLVLLAACAFTTYELRFMGELFNIPPGFVVGMTIRNALLLVYLGLVLVPMLAGSRLTGRARETSPTAALSSP